MQFLIADDDLVSRLALADQMKAIPNADIVFAEDGQQAWTLLAGIDKPAMLLLDLRMPEMGGIELLGLVRADQRFADWPVMLITATADREAVGNAAKLGVSGLLVKPFPADTASRIQKIARGYEDQILPSADAGCTKLGIDANRYGVYIRALIKQLDVLVAESQRDDPADVTSLRSRVDVCRSAATTLNSTFLVSELTALRTHIDSATATQGLSLSRGRVAMAVNYLKAYRQMG